MLAPSRKGAKKTKGRYPARFCATKILILDFFVPLRLGTRMIAGFYSNWGTNYENPNHRFI
jgi:hypothetical protein